MSGKLFLVGTPIGNLGDISPRCAQILELVDFIAAEDTRVSVRLLNHLGIKKTMVSYYEHNKKESGEKILRRLAAGESCALVTDAGMPAISDPGEELVRLCAQMDIEVTAVPGPCAAVTALALSGLSAGRFTFEGFLSVTKKNRAEHLRSLKNEARTMIFYEAPHKLKNTVEDLIAVFGGDRRIALCRELTKLHEEIIRTTLKGASEYCDSTPPRGEFVLVVEGASESGADISPDDALNSVAALRAAGLSLKDAVRRISEETGISKNLLYQKALDAEL
ncbi:MAG: 16S rRNA (cytidine(1402)-2'-O)-methyltransferase [Oscillospiraceae bacterium]|nr:16S rRNA (cytidine(1402)-2'-O)-methyltransferase [Oscillospiraceae bacterium]